MLPLTTSRFIQENKALQRCNKAYGTSFGTQNACLCARYMYPSLVTKWPAPHIKSNIQRYRLENQKNPVFMFIAFLFVPLHGAPSPSFATTHGF